MSYWCSRCCYPFVPLLVMLIYVDQRKISQFSPIIPAYSLCLKKQPLRFLDITLTNEYRFSKFFHCHIPVKTVYTVSKNAHFFHMTVVSTNVDQFLCFVRYMPLSCVCVSVTSRCSTKTAKPRNTRTTPHDSPGMLVFWCQNLFEIQTGSPPTGAPNAGGVGRSWRISTNNSPYLKNGTR